MLQALIWLDFTAALQMRLGLGPNFATGQYNTDSSQQYFMNEAAQKAKEAADLQAKIQEKLSKRPGLVSLQIFLPLYFMIWKFFL